MLTLCPFCKTQLRNGEPHPSTLCAVLLAARRLCEDARPAPEGRIVHEDAFQRLCGALGDLDALTPDDIEALREDGTLGCKPHRVGDCHGPDTGAVAGPLVPLVLKIVLGGRNDLAAWRDTT
ncbi:MAG: hypothetical protein ACO1SX_23980 [Actinomycetota bacterium]